MFRHNAIRVLSLFGVAFALACGGKDSTGPSAQAELVLKNSSNINILVVNHTSCSDPSWGPDRLGANEVIAPGAQRRFTVAPGCTDVRARSIDGDQEWFDLTMTAGNTTTLEAGTFNMVSAAGERAAAK